MSLSPVVLLTQIANAGSPPLVYPKAPDLSAHGPRPDYLANLREPSYRQTTVRPKSCLLVLDIDNTLIKPVDADNHTVAARPYLREFMEWALNPGSPYLVAIWTYSSRVWAIAHLRAVGLGDLLFRSSDALHPLLAPGLISFRAYEDSGLTLAQMDAQAYPPAKDLQVVWDELNLNSGRGAVHFGPENSVLVDDQSINANRQPANYILADYYDNQCDDTKDDFLLMLIGALEDLAHEDNFAHAIHQRGWDTNGLPVDADDLLDSAINTCASEGIVIKRPRPAPVKTSAVSAARAALQLGPTHDTPAISAIQPRVRITQSALPRPVVTLSSSVTLRPPPPSPTTSVSSFTDNEDDEMSDPDDSSRSRFVSEEDLLNNHSDSDRNLTDRQRLAQAVSDWERDAPDDSLPLVQSEPYELDRKSYFRSDSLSLGRRQ